MLAALRRKLELAQRELNDLNEDRERERRAAAGVRATREKMRLHEFVRGAWDVLEPDNPFADNWHINCICEHLEAVTALEIRQLIINIPPRFAKSLLVSVYWFAWVWSLNPYSRWIYSTYSEGFANRDGRKSLQVLQSAWYRSRFGDLFTLSKDAEGYLLNDKQGFRVATTLGGKATGEGGSYFVVDDPMKASDAESPVKRQNVIDWWTGTTPTRSAGDPKTFRRVVVMQRLHERDLSGYLAAEVGGYEHLVLPMEYEPRRYWLPDSDKPKPRNAITPTVVQRRSITARDPRTVEGELLWPSRFTRELVENWKKELLHRAAGQLAQRPADPEGSVFRRSTFRYFQMEERQGRLFFVLADPTGENPARLVPVDECRMFQVSDTAVKIRKRNDYTAITTAFLAPGGNLLLYEVTQAKIESPHLTRYLKTCAFGPTSWDAASLRPVRRGYWPNKIRPFKQYVEDAASGSTVIQTAALDGAPVTPLSGAGDKLEKAMALATLYENGKVYHLAGAYWLPDFEDELTTFPNAAHDDRTDSASGAGRVATRDAVLRMGIAALEEVAEEYPEFQEWKKEEAENKAADELGKRLRKEAIDSAGLSEEDVRAASKRADKEAEQRKRGNTFRIEVAGGELELPDD